MEDGQIDPTSIASSGVTIHFLPLMPWHVTESEICLSIVKWMIEDDQVNLRSNVGKIWKLRRQNHAMCLTFIIGEWDCKGYGCSHL